eukprot:TRINITY_DN922_c0_g1_i5.p1 TRINITY_DN922_c0_g1~~TRINITY_DN922_c0_g1_i5.p1  ORF type:complete len:647 (+),score=65.31 TRINITY_DN922_c0_g1_i5:553-2493(+)
MSLNGPPGRRPASASLTFFSKGKVTQNQGRQFMNTTTTGKDEALAEEARSQTISNPIYQSVDAASTIDGKAQLQERAKRYLKMNSTRQPRFWKYTKKFDVDMKASIRNYSALFPVDPILFDENDDDGRKMSPTLKKDSTFKYNAEEEKERRLKLESSIVTRLNDQKLLQDYVHVNPSPPMSDVPPRFVDQSFKKHIQRGFNESLRAYGVRKEDHGIEEEEETALIKTGPKGYVRVYDDLSDRSPDRDLTMVTQGNHPTRIIHKNRDTEELIKDLDNLKAKISAKRREANAKRPATAQHHHNGHSQGQPNNASAHTNISSNDPQMNNNIYGHQATATQNTKQLIRPLATVKPEFYIETPGNSNMVSPHDHRVQEMIKAKNKSRPRTAKASAATHAGASSSPGRPASGDGIPMTRPGTGRSQPFEGKMFDSLLLSEKFSSYGGGFNNTAPVSTTTRQYSPKKTMKSPVMRSSVEFVFDSTKGQAGVVRKSVDDPSLAFKDVYEKDDNKITMRYRKKVMRPRSAMEATDKRSVSIALQPKEQTMPSASMIVTAMSPSPLIIESGKYKLAFKTLNLGIKGVQARQTDFTFFISSYIKQAGCKIIINYLQSTQTLSSLITLYIFFMMQSIIFVISFSQLNSEQSIFIKHIC